MRPAFLVASLFLPIFAMANDSGACYSITDSDARTFCLARAHKDPGRCYSIKAQDVRAACLAEVRSTK